LQTVPEECVVRCFLVAPSEIHFLRFILEAYEGIGMITTLDPALGLVQLRLAQGCEEEIDQILDSEARSLKLRAITLRH